MYGGAWAYNKISFLNFETTSMVSRRKMEVIITTTEAVFQENCTDRMWMGYGNEVCKVKKGKKIMAGLIFLILMTVLMTVFTGCNKTDKITDTTENPIIKIGSDNYPPYNFLNEDGMPTGIDVDLATEAFGRMGYKIEIVPISWEQKKKMLENGEIDCIMGCFSMKGRLDDYQWAGPYMTSRQVVAVNPNSDIYKLSDLEGKKLAVQSTTKPEEIFLHRRDERIPKLGNLISLANRELIYTFLGKGYVDAVGAHEESIIQYMKDYNMELRILDEPLMTVGLGVAFAKDDTRGLCKKLEQTLADMKEDGTAAKIIGKYLDDPEKYLEVDKIGEE